MRDVGANPRRCPLSHSPRHRAMVCVDQPPTPAYHLGAIARLGSAKTNLHNKVSKTPKNVRNPTPFLPSHLIPHLHTYMSTRRCIIPSLCHPARPPRPPCWPLLTAADTRLRRRLWRLSLWCAPAPFQPLSQSPTYRPILQRRCDPNPDAGESSGPRRSWPWVTL